MRADIRSLLQASGLEDRFSLNESDGVRLKDFGSCHFPEPLRFEGSIASENGGILRLRGELCFKWESSCVRCLKEVKGERSIEVDEQIYPQGYYADSSHHLHHGGEGFAEEAEVNLDPEELAFHDGQFFEADKLFQDLALLSLPIGVYCRADCPRLCPQCGRPKDDPACHCEENEDSEERIPGPFDKLRDLL